MSSNPPLYNCNDISEVEKLFEQVQLQSDDRDTPLVRAVRLGSLELVQLLLEKGPDVHGASQWPIVLAAELGHTEIVKLLLDRGASVNQRDTDRGTAIEAATLAGHIDTMSLLCQAGARLDYIYPNEETILDRAVKLGDPHLVSLLVGSVQPSVAEASFTKAISSGSIEMARLFVDLGVDLAASPEGTLALLIQVARTGRLEILKLLTGHGWQPTNNALDDAVILHAAIEEEQLDVVAFLLEVGVDMENAVDSQTALHSAVFSGNFDVTKLLLEWGANLEAVDSHLHTPLYLAVKNHQHTIADYLLKKGANVKAENVDRISVFLYAAMDGLADMMKLMLKFREHVEGASAHEIRGFRLGVQNGHPEIVQLMLDLGVDVNNVSEVGRTALNTAVERGHLEVVRVLLRGGADTELPSMTEQGLCTPLGSAACAGRLDMVGLLLDYDADHSATQGVNCFTPLHFACRNEEPEMTRLLLDKGADANVRKPDGWTPLHLAARNGCDSCVRILFEYWADPHIVCENGWTPLSYAIRYHHAETIKALVEGGADCNFGNKPEGPALCIAVKQGPASIVELLIELGADLTLLDPWEQTPLNIAAGFGEVEVVELLLQKGAYINSGDDDGYTPLYNAAESGHTRTVRLLLDSGADPSIKTKKNFCRETALHKAMCQGHMDVMSLLFDALGQKLPIDAFERSPVFLAIRHGHYHSVKHLIEMDGRQVRARDMYGGTLLGAAIRNGNEHIARLLFDAEKPSLDTNELLGKSYRWWLSNVATPGMKELCRSIEDGTVGSADDPDSRWAVERLPAYCDICLMPLARFQPRYHCAKCSSECFDACPRCFELGGKCLVQSHELVYYETSPYDDPTTAIPPP